LMLPLLAKPLGRLPLLVTGLLHFSITD